MALSGATRLCLQPIPLERDITRAGVGALALLAEPLAPFRQLGLSLLRLTNTLGHVGFHLVQTRELARERLRALGGGRRVDAAARELGNQLGLAGLRGVDRRSGRRHRRLLTRLGLARRLDEVLE